MNTLPTISSYGDYSSNNYGAHTLKVTMGDFALFYSYQTIVAFSDSRGFFCSENVWSSTTGKHLNMLEPNKKNRLPHHEFEVELQNMLSRHLTKQGEE